MSASAPRPPNGPPVVLVVEDEPVLRASMVRGLARLPGIEVVDGAGSFGTSGASARAGPIASAQDRRASRFRRRTGFTDDSPVRAG